MCIIIKIKKYEQKFIIKKKIEIGIRKKQAKNIIFLLINELNRIVSYRFYSCCCWDCGGVGLVRAGSLLAAVVSSMLDWVFSFLLLPLLLLLLLFSANFEALEAFFFNVVRSVFDDELFTVDCTLYLLRKKNSSN